MKTDFDYQAVPQGFIHCFKDDCSRSDTCLRRLAARHCTADKPLITILSPAAVPADSSQGSYVLPIQKTRVAWGVRNLFDDVPLSLAADMRHQIVSYFGKTHYYRIYRKERFITPEGQRYIRHIFTQNGITDALQFESYSEVYKW